MWRFWVLVFVFVFFFLLVVLFKWWKLRLTRRGRNSKSFIKKSLAKSVFAYFVPPWKSTLHLGFGQPGGFLISSKLQVACDPGSLLFLSSLKPVLFHRCFSQWSSTLSSRCKACLCDVTLFCLPHPQMSILSRSSSSWRQEESLYLTHHGFSFLTMAYSCSACFSFPRDQSLMMP